MTTEVVDAPTDTVPEPVSENVDSTTTSEAFDATFRDIEVVMRDFKGAVSKLRQLKREIVAMEKSLRKHEERRARRKRAALDENGNKRKNGFSLENNLISDELADFIGHEHGQPISRSEVTRRLTAYVKANGLQDDSDKRFVNLDSDAGQKLKAILSDIVDKEGNPARLTIITINKFVNKHYIGKVEAPVVVDDSVTDEVVQTPSEGNGTAPKESPVTGEKMAAKKDVTMKIKKKKLIKKTAVV